MNFRERMDELHELEKSYPMDYDQWESFDGPTAYWAEVATDEEWGQCVADFKSSIVRAEIRYNDALEASRGN